MRIIVISDTHGRPSLIEKIIEAQPDAKDIFFLGDLIKDIEDMPFMYPSRNFHIVSGNCDYGSTYKTADAVTVGGPREGRSSYAVIDIEPNGIMPVIIMVNESRNLQVSTNNNHYKKIKEKKVCRLNP